MVEDVKIHDDFKESELGMIPEDWDVKPLENEVDLLTGFPFPSNKYSETGIRLLRGSNVKRGVTDWAEDNTKYWKEITPELKEYVLKDGDIVIAMDGSLVGKSFARLSQSDLPALLLQRIARVRSSKIDMGYLKEFICSDYFTKYLDSVKTASAIPHISPKDIRNFQVPLPPTKAEQTAIATVLNDTNTLITRLEKLIAKKQLIKQGAMQELLRPKEGWEERKLGEIIVFSNGKAHEQFIDENGQYKVINSKFVSTEGEIVKYSNQNISPLFEGDIAIVMSDIPNGKALAKCFIIDEDNKYTLNQRIGSIKPKSGDSKYYYYHLNRNKYFLSFDSGTGQTNLRKSDILDCPISLPLTLEEQWDPLESTCRHASLSIL